MMLSSHKQLRPLFLGFFSQQLFTALMRVAETVRAQPHLREEASQ